MTEDLTSHHDSPELDTERPLSLMQRRRFLQAAAVVGAGAAVSPTVLAQAAGAQSSNTNTIVVTVTLEGGNDGLNLSLIHI